ncbi:hypothetical protein [Streptomyces erythrochromogenes]|uniref:hypothetical protein n=1 Tax=Streptomyces erythrochromogenes TaxID=285574 RepID=UPI00367AC329
MSMKKTTTAALALSALALVAAAWAGYGQLQPAPADGLSLAHDLDDERVLAGRADSVVTATVVGRSAPVDIDGIPWIDYTVRVTDTLKGPLVEGVEAVIRQEADYGPDGTVVAYPADPFLTEGSAHIFATRYSERIDRHVFLDALHGRVPLTPRTTATWTDAVAHQRTD